MKNIKLVKDVVIGKIEDVLDFTNGVLPSDSFVTEEDYLVLNIGKKLKIEDNVIYLDGYKYNFYLDQEYYIEVK